MKTSEFDYDLPHELIAQVPLANRTDSRMLVVHKNANYFEDSRFSNIVSLFHAGDVLVRNNTRVIPARLFGTKEETGAHVELLLLRQEEDDVWECLVGNAKVVKPGVVVSFHDGRLKAKCVSIGEKGIRRMKMIYDGIFNEILDSLGNVPLPPYIKEKLDDPERYQTVYAKIRGSAAAPTAGLHFTDEIFAKLQEVGVIIADVTLHVGLGTFRPMDTEEVEEHVMHSEWIHMPVETAEILNKARQENRRIIAVGTTSARTLESVWNACGCFAEYTGDTSLFIFPGYEWHAVDCMLTNFHLPKSTLIMMIASFAGKDLVLSAYRHAVKERYRFFSFGDCMFVTNE